MILKYFPTLETTIDIWNETKNKRKIDNYC